MTCGGCVANVRKELLKLNGILSAKITYKPQQAVIRYNPKETGPKHFIHAIKRAGYDVLTQTTGNKKSKPSKKLALLPAAMPHLKQAFNRDKKYVRLLFMFSPV